MVLFSRFYAKLKNVLLADKATAPIFEVEGHHFSSLKLLHTDSRYPVSKAGLLSWKALMDDLPVKIYECFNETQAILIQQLSQEPTVKGYFPECFLRQKRFLVVEWVQGTALTWPAISRNPSILQQITRLQAGLHRCQATLDTMTNCHYLQFLKSRIEKFKGPLPINKAIQKIYYHLDESLPHMPQRISHPDITASNLVLDNDENDIKIIDNELLTRSSFYLFDLFNTHFSFRRIKRPEFQTDYLASYCREGGDLTALVEHAEAFSALWHLRMISTRLQRGKFSQALDLADNYTAGTGGQIHPMIYYAQGLYRQ